MLAQIDYVMVTVQDMRRSVEFYRDKLGLKLKFESEFWTEFNTGATTLALHGGGLPRPSGAEPPRGESYAGSGALGFSVKNIQEVFGSLRARGVHFVMPPTVREEEGIKLAVCTDPDGFPISFAEPLHHQVATPTAAQHP